MQIATTAGLALCLLAAPARAGLDITWNACPSNAGLSDIAFACANPSALHTLFGELQSTVAVPGFISLECIVDLQVDAAALTPFHTFTHPVTNPTGCNPGWTFEIFLPAAGCAGAGDLWVGLGPVGPPEIPQGYYPGVGGPNRGRFVFFPARPMSNPIQVDADVTYYAFSLKFYTALASSCSGCTTPIQIAFNEAALGTSSGVAATVTGPGDYSNFATTLGGGNIPSPGTAAKRTSWTALKSLYR